MYQTQKKANDIENLLLLSDTADINCEAFVIKCQGDIPTPRNDHRTFLKDRKIFIYGGTTLKGDATNMFSIDIGRLMDGEAVPFLQYKEIALLDKNDSVLPSSGTSFASWSTNTYNHLKQYVLMYGGWTGDKYSDQLMLLNVNTMEVRSLLKEEPKAEKQQEKQTPRFAISVGNSKQIQKYQLSKSPPSRKDHTMVYIPSENKICLYGGWDGHYTSGAKQELWILSSNWKWQRYPGYSRRGHTSVVVDDHRGNGFLVFGGFKGVKHASNESLFFDVKNKKWHTIKQTQKTPKGRAYHTANLIGNKIVYIGGMGENYEIFNEVWVFCLDQHTWTEVTIKDVNIEKGLKRAGHATFCINKKIYIIGGMTQNGSDYERCPMNEIICLDFSDFACESKQPPKKTDQAEFMHGVHNVDHHWDVTAFGVTLKKDNLQDFYKDLMEKGITDQQME